MTLQSLFWRASGIQDHQRAVAAFAAIISFDARLKVCHEIMGTYNLSPTDRLVWNGIFAAAQKLMKARNECAHFGLASGSSGASIVPYFSWATLGDGKPSIKQVSVDEIGLREAKFNDLSHSFLWVQGLVEFLNEGTPRDPLPNPDLVLRLQAKAALTLAET